MATKSICAIARRSVGSREYAANGEKCAVKSGRKIAIRVESAEINFRASTQFAEATESIDVRFYGGNCGSSTAGTASGEC
jgi:hypothetical protein